jgi:hypothetical protein
MSASVTFFPVGNGDMTLIQLDNDQTVLIDIHVRSAADDPDDEMPDVMTDLRGKLKRDELGRLYVDAFLLSHPDKDHICGLEEHFHLGPPSDWDEDEDKIVIREMWSSPLVFRRAGEEELEVDDAQAWWKEARRRVARFKEAGFQTTEGDRILIMGQDVDGKTDDVSEIVIPTGATFSAVNRVSAGAFEGCLLGPLPPSDDKEEEEVLSTNASSVIVRFSIRGGGVADKCRFLCGGDAGVAIWERLWAEYDGTDRLTYDILLAPHHCSWRSLSYDSYSEHGEDAEVCEAALHALAGARDGAIVVASSRAIKPEDPDPPSDRAKREYISILDDDDERFLCVADHWDDHGVALQLKVGAEGLELGTPGNDAPIEVKGMSAAIFGISATEQLERAQMAAEKMRAQSSASKPWGSDCS